MCQECRQSICPSSCPNADDPPIFEKCCECGEEIYDGDYYHEICGSVWCEECIKDTLKQAEVNY